jgi:hypothetical protein
MQWWAHSHTHSHTVQFTHGNVLNEEKICCRPVLVLQNIECVERPLAKHWVRGNTSVRLIRCGAINRQLRPAFALSRLPPITAPAPSLPLRQTGLRLRFSLSLSAHKPPESTVLFSQLPAQFRRRYRHFSSVFSSSSSRVRPVLHPSTTRRKKLPHFPLTVFSPGHVYPLSYRQPNTIDCTAIIPQK